MAGEAIAAVAFDDRKPAIVTTTYRYKGSVRPRAKTTATSNFCDGPAGEGGHLPAPAPADT